MEYDLKGTDKIKSPGKMKGNLTIVSNQLHQLEKNDMIKGYNKIT